MNNCIVIIPARLASSRLERKLLQDVAGKPLLYHTYQSALHSNAREVIIAADSSEIMQVCEEYNMNAVLTSSAHTSGTSRIKEVVHARGFTDEVIVNVQGDEPLMPSENITQLAQGFEHHDALIATLYEPFTTLFEVMNANNVKVVVNSKQEAMYFSRSVIPCYRDDEADLGIYKKHIGIYGYRAEFFHTEFSHNTYEKIEKLEQLSILESGYGIHIEQAKKNSGIGVDTMDDLEQVRSILSGNN